MLGQLEEHEPLIQEPGSVRMDQQEPGQVQGSGQKEAGLK